MTLERAKSVAEFAVLRAARLYSLDMRGEKTSSIDFAFDSSKLIDDDKLPCEYGTPSYHALTKYLGIQEWLHHSVEAMQRTGSRLDKPSFSSDVLIKFSGSSGHTYTSQRFLSFERFFGRRKCWLAISMLTWIAGSQPAVAQPMLTIPPGEFGRAYIIPPQSISPKAAKVCLIPQNPNYEPVSKFLAPHPVQKASLDVVRVDVQLTNGEQEACSGVLITEK